MVSVYEHQEGASRQELDRCQPLSSSFEQADVCLWHTRETSHVTDVPSTFTSVCTAAMQTGRVRHYIPGRGMISMISIHAPGISR